MRRAWNFPKQHMISMDFFNTKMFSLITYRWILLVFPTLCHPANVTENIGGDRKARDGEFPFVGLVRVVDPKSADPVECGGAIITPLCFVTACQCLTSVSDRDNPNRMYSASKSTVTVGTVYRNITEDAQGGAQVRKGIAFHVHPKCQIINDTDFVAYDVGVMEIEVNAPFMFNDRVQPALLPPPREQDLVAFFHNLVESKNNCQIAGWGILSAGETHNLITGAPFLKVMDVTFTPIESCKDGNENATRNQCETLPKLKKLEEAFLSAVTIGSGFLNYKDTGGPLVCHGRHVVGLLTTVLERDRKQMVLLFTSFLRTFDLIATYLAPEPTSTVGPTTEAMVETVETTSLSTDSNSTGDYQTISATTESPEESSEDSTYDDYDETEISSANASIESRLVTATENTDFPIWTIRVKPRGNGLLRLCSSSTSLVLGAVLTCIVG